MSTLDWTVFGLASVIVLLLVVFRRRPPTAQEIAKEVVVAQIEAAAQAKATATKDCERCRREVPEWFTESLPGEDVCFACSESKPYPGPGETEDAYVEAWMAGKEARKAADRAHTPEPSTPRSIYEPPDCMHWEAMSEEQREKLKKAPWNQGKP
jgi:hypothetical protein